MSLAADFFAKGWVRFPVDPDIARWVDAVRPLAAATLADPEQRNAWLRCGGTWFAGVNALANDADGGIMDAGVPPLAGSPLVFVRDVLGLDGFIWDRAQISVCYPGYPQPSEEETEANFRYRLNRDAAHVDGLLREKPSRRRSLGEQHGFVLGLPLNDVPAGAAPLVVWEGSHQVMREVFRDRLAGIVPGDWAEEDVTEVYVDARRHCFETCARVEVSAQPGEAYIVHRLALHGVAPWTAGEDGPPRSIAYFRPDPFPGQSPDWWLERD
ncbi:MAG: hypothetical protein AAGJ28_03630 [Pseudomonadota bacterium]